MRSFAIKMKWIAAAKPTVLRCDRTCLPERQAMRRAECSSRSCPPLRTRITGRIASRAPGSGVVAYRGLRSDRRYQTQAKVSRPRTCGGGRAAGALREGQVRSAFGAVAEGLPTAAGSGRGRFGAAVRPAGPGGDDRADHLLGRLLATARADRVQRATGPRPGGAVGVRDPDWLAQALPEVAVRYLQLGRGRGYPPKPVPGTKIPFPCFRALGQSGSESSLRALVQLGQATRHRRLLQKRTRPSRRPAHATPLSAASRFTVALHFSRSHNWLLCTRHPRRTRHQRAALNRQALTGCREPAYPTSRCVVGPAHSGCEAVGLMRSS